MQTKDQCLSEQSLETLSVLNISQLKYPPKDTSENEDLFNTLNKQVVDSIQGFRYRKDQVEYDDKYTVESLTIDQALEILNDPQMNKKAEPQTEIIDELADAAAEYGKILPNCLRQYEV